MVIFHLWNVDLNAVNRNRIEMLSASVNASPVNSFVCNEAISLLTMSSSVTSQSLSLDISAVAMVMSLLPSHWFLEIVENILDRCRLVNFQNRRWHYKDFILFYNICLQVF